jgi:ParB/RepB/Spo0J family partition protein
VNRKKVNPKEIFNSELAVDAGCESQGVFNPNDFVKVTQSIDPKFVRISEMHKSAFEAHKGSKFKNLSESMKASNGNIQPIHVIKLKETGFVENSPEWYELIEGKQRLVAAIKNRQNILAFVFDDLDEFSRYVINITANFSKNNPSPYELGCKLLSLINLHPKISLDEIGKIIGYDKSTVSRAIQLAKLDFRIVESFDSPSNLTYRDELLLRKAMERNSGNVLTEALFIKDERKEYGNLIIKKSVVISRLVNASKGGFEESSKDSKSTITLDDNSEVKIYFGPKGILIKSNFEMDNFQKVDLLEKIKELLNKFMIPSSTGSATDFDKKEDLGGI